MEQTKGQEGLTQKYNGTAQCTNVMYICHKLNTISRKQDNSLFGESGVKILLCIYAYVIQNCTGSHTICAKKEVILSKQFLKCTINYV